MRTQSQLATDEGKRVWEKRTAAPNADESEGEESEGRMCTITSILANAMTKTRQKHAVSHNLSQSHNAVCE